MGVLKGTFIDLFRVTDKEKRSAIQLIFFLLVAGTRFERMTFGL